VIPGRLTVAPLPAEDWEVHVSDQSKAQIDSINATTRLTIFSNIEEAIDLFRKNVADAKSIGYQLGEAKASIHLGLALYLKGQYDESVGSYLHAIRIFEAANSIDGLVTAYGDLGYQMKRRDLAGGKKYMLKAIQIAGQYGLYYRLMGLYDNYGVLQEMSNQLDSAFYFYDRALKLKHEMGDTLGIPYSLNHLAGLFAMQKEFSKARFYLKESDRYRVKESGEFGKLYNTVLWGDLFHEMGLLDSAIIMYRLVTETPEAFEQKYQVTYCFEQLADIYQKKEDYHSAFKNLKHYQTYRDSLLNIESNARIARLEIEYETEKKDRELTVRQLKIERRNTLLALSGLLLLLLFVMGFGIYKQMTLAMSRKELEMEAERHHISREMHDNIGTSLTSILYKTELIKRHLPHNRDKVDKLLSFLIRDTQESISNVREVIWAVDKTDVIWEDFCAFLKEWGTSFFQSSEQISFRFSKSDDGNFIVKPKVKLNILRIFQEASTNILKYAKATEVNIDISTRNGIIHLLVEDNGKGFDIEKKEEEKINHLGLKNMEARVEELGGRFSISTKPKAGTRIQISIPIE